MKVGIDIGTSHSSICILSSDGKPEPIKIDSGLSIFGNEYSLPSAVFLHNDDFVIGQAACNRRVSNPSNFKSEFKRDFGQESPYTIGERHVYPHDLYKELFVYLISRLEEISDEIIECAYITHPATFSNKQKELLIKTANQAGLLNIQLIEEPVAAAFNYLSENELKNGELVLVYDFGGGTFDAALLKYENKVFQLIESPIGIERCGGIDFDNELFQYIKSIANEHFKKCNDNLQMKNFALSKIQEEAVKAKHHLSEALSATGQFDIAMNLVEYSVGRVDFNKLIAKYVDDSINCIAQLISNAGLNKQDVDIVVLVGGSSRIPLVKEKLIHFFSKEIKIGTNPELAIVKGAFNTEIIKNKDSTEKQDEGIVISESLENFKESPKEEKSKNHKVVPSWQNNTKRIFFDTSKIE